MITDIKDITSFKWATVTAINPLAIKLDGDTAALALIPDSIVDPTLLRVNDRVRVELSLRKVVIHGVASRFGAAFYQGTAAQRDAVFGVPATAAARLALHNRGAQWFNTERNWTEQYFTTTADGAVAGKGAVWPNAGWYPLHGALPTAALQVNTVYGYSTGSSQRIFFDTLSVLMQSDLMTYDLSGSTQTGGSIRVGMAGRYEVSFNAGWTHSASGTWVDITGRIYNGPIGGNTGSLLGDIMNSATAHPTPNWFTESQHKTDVHASAGNYFQMWMNTGSGTMYFQNRGGQTRFAVKYVAPPFV